MPAPSIGIYFYFNGYFIDSYFDYFSYLLIIFLPMFVLGAIIFVYFSGYLLIS